MGKQKKKARIAELEQEVRALNNILKACKVTVIHYEEKAVAFYPPPSQPRRATPADLPLDKVRRWP